MRPLMPRLMVALSYQPDWAWMKASHGEMPLAESRACSCGVSRPERTSSVGSSDVMEAANTVCRMAAVSVASDSWSNWRATCNAGVSGEMPLTCPGIPSKTWMTRVRPRLSRAVTSYSTVPRDGSFLVAT